MEKRVKMNTGVVNNGFDQLFDIYMRKFKNIQDKQDDTSRNNEISGVYSIKTT